MQLEPHLATPFRLGNLGYNGGMFVLTLDHVPTACGPLALQFISSSCLRSNINTYRAEIDVQ